MNGFEMAADVERNSEDLIAKHGIHAESGKAILSIVGQIDLDESKESFGEIRTSVIAQGDPVAMQEMLYAELSSEIETGNPPELLFILASAVQAVMNDYDISQDMLDQMLEQKIGWVTPDEDNRVLH